MRWLLLTLFNLAVAPCYAHDAQLSGFTFIYASNGNLTISVATHISKLRNFEQVSAERKQLEAALLRRIRLRINERNYSPRTSHLNLDPANDLIVWQGQYSALVTRLEVLSRLYPEDATSRCTVAVFRKGRVIDQGVVDANAPDFIFNATSPHQEKSTPLRIIFSFGKMGVAHIFGGVDHVLFVIGLLLLGGSLKTLLKIVTAFTVAHSLTLTAAVLGVWSPAPHLIEPLIALSIVAIAIENLHHQKTKNEHTENSQNDWRSTLAFGFGLIHGFGFAGALAESGLPREGVGWALAAFNVGVEAGQATIVLMVAPLLVTVARKLKMVHCRTVTIGSVVIGVLGVLLFVQRIMG